jgi:hypothetical protein
MEREVITFTDRKEIAGIVLDYGDDEDWKIISDEIYDQRRWETCHIVVLKRISDGKFFITHYSVGSTEYQDQSPYENDDMIFREVKPIEKTITTYGWID